MTYKIEITPTNVQEVKIYALARRKNTTKQQVLQEVVAKELDKLIEEAQRNG